MWFGGRLTRGGGGWQGGRSSSVPVTRFLARPAPRVIRRAKVVPCLSKQTSVFTGLFREPFGVWKSKVSERKGNEPNGDGGKLVLAGLEFWMAAAAGILENQLFPQKRDSQLANRLDGSGIYFDLIQISPHCTRIAIQLVPG